MALYEYSPLKQSEIRLVRVRANEQGELYATLEHVTLNFDDPIAYSALSYVWGNAAITLPLPCEGKTLNITTTLHEALREAIKFDSNNGLWIDQICINQNNLDERSTQVKMMNMIFEKAETVIAWLGPATSSTALTIDFISKVGAIALPKTTDIFRAEAYPDDRERIETYENITIEESKQLGISFEDEEPWAAFSDFFDRPWFQRIWIVQEILPARKAIFLCGANSIEWTVLNAAAQWYHYKAALVSKSHQRIVDGISLTVAMNIPWCARYGSEFHKDLFGQKTHATFKWPLRSLLEQFRPRLATEPKDKVYALLGVSEMGTEFSGQGVDFTVDYSQSLREVFALATKAMICSGDVAEDNLDIIMAARRRSTEADWPSWVPDWRSETGYGCEWGIGHPLPTSLNNWSGSKFGKHRFADSGNSHTLAVEGVVVGRSTYISPYHHLTQMLVEGGLRECHEVCVDELKSYPTGEDIEQAYALTVMAGDLPVEMTSKGTTAEAYTENYLEWADIMLMPIDTPEKRKVRQHAALEHFELGFTNNWAQHLLRSYCERRFYITDTGFIGLGNHNMRDGDLVVAVFGLSVPCVLRPRGESPEDGYEFIGEAYCHGIMNGEVIQMFGLSIDEDRFVSGGQRFVLH
ncbi:Fc.00g070440.m01.CDS01 [Cosmosporella sp. VM-42]